MFKDAARKMEKKFAERHGREPAADKGKGAGHLYLSLLFRPYLFCSHRSLSTQYPSVLLHLPSVPSLKTQAHPPPAPPRAQQQEEGERTVPPPPALAVPSWR